MNLGKSLFAVILVCLINVPAMALTQKFDLKVNLTINGKKISTPKLIIKEGQKGMISYLETAGGEPKFIEIVAKNDKDFGPDVIFLDLKLGHGEKKKEIETEPEMLVKNNTPGFITIMDGQSDNEMKLEVTAKRL